MKTNIIGQLIRVTGILGIPLAAFTQVNLQTGSANYSVPIYNFQDNKSQLSLPITIGYNSGNGLRVDEVATDVGQGWGLMAGGKIIRNQIGEPDDQKPQGEEGSTENSYDLSKYPAGYLYTNQNPSNGAPINFGRYPIFAYQNRKYRQHNAMNADREADYFSINVNGISATFILDKSTFNTSTGIGEGVFLGSTLMKVKFFTVLTPTQTFNHGGVSDAARTTIYKFILTDENGLSYHFEQRAFTKIRRLAASDRRFITQQNPPKKYKKRQVYHETYFDDPDIINPYIVNEWHLSKISDDFLFTERSINFSYAYRAIEQWVGFDYTTQNANKDYGKVLARKAFVIIPVIDFINCPNGYKIQFNYGAQRLDVPNAYLLKSISVTYGTRQVQRHVLKHSYVIYTRYGTPITDEQKLACRLYLLAITKYTADLKDAEKPYQFDYYLGGNSNLDFVPPPFFASKDIWGYYDGCLSITGGASTLDPSYKAYCVNGSRGNINNEFPSFTEIKRLSFKDGGNTTIKTGIAKNGLLKTIEYPSGGMIQFEYAQRRAKFVNETVENDIGGVEVSATKLYDGGYSNGCNNNGITTNYKYINENGSSSLEGVERPITYLQSKSEYKAFGRIYKFHPLLYKIKCLWRFQHPGIQYTDQALQVSGYQALMSNSFAENVSMAMDVFSTLQNINTIKNVGDVFNKFAVASAWVSLILDIGMGLYELIATCTLDVPKVTTNQVWYNRDLNAANPLPTMYKRVEVIEGNGNLGKTITEFTSFDDYPAWVANNPLFNMQQRCGSWLYGLPKRVLVYNSVGKKVKEIVNTYDTDLDTCRDVKTGRLFFCTPKRKPLEIYSCNIQPLLAKPTEWLTWVNHANLQAPAHYTKTNTSEVAVSIYQHYTGYLQLLSTKETIFDQNTESKELVKTTKYKYTDWRTESDNFQPIEIEEIPSSGISTLKVIKYNNVFINLPAGIGNNDALNKLYNKGIRNVPVETIISTKRLIANETYKQVRKELNEFVMHQNGRVGLKKVFVWRTAAPVADISMLTPAVAAEMHYDADGIEIANTDEGGRTVKYLFDYDKQLRVATVINLKDVANETIGYNSFESDEKHGFSFNGNKVTGAAITGAKYYALNASNSITANMSNPANRVYTLSFWSTNAVNVQGGTLITSAPIRNGYTFYEYEIQPATAIITISGNANVDEIRLYPKGARMTTTTYDPLVGKTSENDQNNKYTTFEYDKRGRLSMIKDEVGSIVKMYEYGERFKFDKCPITFRSHAVFEVIKRNNCSAGFVGGYVDYLLAEGAFTSSISQEHADLLAEQAIAQYAQQYANNNATCTQIYYNDAFTNVFYRDDCAPGTEPVAYTYTVPANKYSSTLNKADANDQAEEDLADNGQALANQFGACITVTTAQWQADENAPLRCNNGITQAQLRDVNPNSATYNQTQWFNLEEDLNNCGNTQSTIVRLGPDNTYPFIIEFTNTITGQSYSFQTYRSIGLNGEMGSIPYGTYTISFYPKPQSAGQGIYNYSIDAYSGVFNGNSSFGNTVTISNVQISGNEIIFEFN